VAVFYRGAGVNTYWHNNDARISGFIPLSSGTTATVNCLMDHIVYGTVSSPFVSLTRSYGVAWDYAVNAGRQRPTPNNPAYVYRIEISNPPPINLTLLDPIKFVAQNLPSALDPPYQHDGMPSFLLGVVDPIGNVKHRSAPYTQPPPGGGASRPPNLTTELEALVKALRDAEILAVGTIPASCITARYPIY